MSDKVVETYEGEELEPGPLDTSTPALLVSPGSYQPSPSTLFWWPDSSYHPGPKKCEACKGKGKLKPLPDGFRPICPKCKGKKHAY